MKTLTQAPVATHTPGPWKLADLGRDVGIVSARDGFTSNIAVCSRLYRDEAMDCKANATLIAAAPDLLAALENAAAQFDFTVAALAKGQTVSISSLQNCAAAARAAIAKAEGTP